MSSQELLTAANAILDSLSDGVYVCDTERRIVFWSTAAARITGWESADVVGRRCLDGVLCHIDNNGHRLCGEEFCPLHRAMVTGTQSTVGIIVFAQGKKGNRIPLQVTVSPIRNAAGEIIGGVEMFRDVSAMLADLERAKRIQALSLETHLPADPRVRFSTYYVPHDLVGGDFYAIRQLDGDHYGFLLADVMGHGVAAALHTMHLSSLWERHYRLLAEPERFAQTVNSESGEGREGRIVRDRAVRGHRRRKANPAVCFRRRPAGPGGRAGGTIEEFGSSGLPLGMMEDAEYEADRGAGSHRATASSSSAMVRRKCITRKGNCSGVPGLARLLQGLGYPAAGLQISRVEEQLLLFSNEIRLTDDLTFIEVRF